MKAIIDWKTYECTLVEEQKKEWASNGLYIGEDIPTQYSSWCIYRQTLAQAQRHNKRLEAYKNIRKRKTENDWDFVEDWEIGNKPKYCIGYDYARKKLFGNYRFTVRHNDIYFSSEEICEKAIKEIEEDILIYLGAKQWK